MPVIKEVEWSAGMIARFRRFLRLYQTEFAAHLLVSAQTVQDWESGRKAPDLKNLAKLDIWAREKGFRP